MDIRRRKFLKLAGAAALGPVAFSSYQLPKSKCAQDLLSGLKSMTDDIKPIEKADFEERHNRARALMRKEGIDCLYLSGSTNLYYFSGIIMGGRDRLFAMFLPQEGSPTFVSPKFEVPSALERIKYGEEDIRTWEEHEDPYKLAADVLREKGIDKGTIGVDENLPFWYYDRLAKAAPQAKYRNADVICHKLRAIKSPKEIALLRRAVEITLKAHDVAYKSIYKGMNQDEFRQNFVAATQKMGAHSPWGGASFGIASTFVHGSIKKSPLEEGMVILADAGCRVDNYSSDVSRTYTLGKASDRVRKVWAVGQKAQLAGIKAVRPGAACQEVDRAIRRVLEEEGFGSGYKYLPHRVGHGLGLDVHEPPYLVEGDTTPMEVGMTFAFDGALYIPGEFGIRLEDDVVVTEDGCEVLGNKLVKSIDRIFD